MYLFLLTEGRAREREGVRRICGDEHLLGSITKGRSKQNKYISTALLFFFSFFCCLSIVRIPLPTLYRPIPSSLSHPPSHPHIPPFFFPSLLPHTLFHHNNDLLLSAS